MEFESLTLLLCVWLFLSISIDFRPYECTEYVALLQFTAKSCLFLLFLFNFSSCCECNQGLQKSLVGAGTRCHREDGLSSGSQQCSPFVYTPGCFSIQRFNSSTSVWVVVKGVVLQLRWQHSWRLSLFFSPMLCMASAFTAVLCILLYCSAWQWDWAVCVQVTVTAIFPGLTASYLTSDFLCKH